MQDARIEALRKMAAARPDDPRPRFGLALELEKAERWEEAAPATHSVLHVIDTDTRIEESHGRAIEVLQQASLFDQGHKTWFG